MILKHANDNWLGTLRGIAVIGVLLTHLLPQVDSAFELNSSLIRAITVSIIDVGKIGVALLFLIAGYLSPTSKNKRNIKQFLINRFCRLYPMYWFCIILVGVFFAFDGYGKSTVFANVTMLQVFMRKEDLVGVFWTLPIELMLYFGCIVFEKYMWRFKRIILLEAICAVATIGIAFIRRFYWSQAPVAIGLLLTVGILGHIFRLYKEEKTKKKELIIAVAVFIALIFVSSLLAYQQDAGHQENWWRYVLSYCIAIMLFIIFMVTEKNIKVFSIIAIVSYPLYLLQEIVLRLFFENELYRLMPSVVFIVSITLVLSIVSILAHLLIEKPMTKIDKKLEQLLR